MRRSGRAWPAPSTLLGDRIPPVLAESLRGRFPSEIVRARLHRGRLAGVLTSLAGADAIVFGRRVFLAARAGASVFSGGAEAAPLLAHELAHVRQYRRLGCAAFLGRYVGEYVGRRLRGARHAAAYRAISFEKEAEEELAAVRDGDRAGELPA